MMKDKFELVRGSGNVFRDFARANAGVEQARAILAAKIIRTLNRMIAILGKLDEEVEVNVTFRPRRHARPERLFREPSVFDAEP